MKFRFPPMEEYTLSNGMSIIWLQSFIQPVLTVTLQLPVGRHYDPVGLEGTTELCVSLMLKGIPSLTSEDFTQKFEQVGASLFVDAKEDYIIFGVRMLNRAANEILPFFWEMICNPAFDNNEFKRLKKEMITGLRAEYSDPSALASRHFCAELFGPLHPGGRNHSINSVKGVTLEQVKEFYKTYIRPQKSLLIVAGAREVPQMQKDWEKLFAAWSKEEKQLPGIDKTIPQLKENRIRIVDKPELSQTTVLIGYPSICELHEKKVALAVANFIFGGGNFSSRLMKRIRTETGRTYSISSVLSTHKEYGVFTIATSTQNSKLEGVISSIFDAYRDFVKAGATESEIEKAKQFAIGNMAFELEGINSIIEKLLWLRFYGRENSYIESYESLISPLNAVEIKDALQKHFTSENFVIVAAGKKSETLSQLETFGSVHAFHYQADPIVN